MTRSNNVLPKHGEGSVDSGATTMKRKLKVLQSLWAMEKRVSGQPELPLLTQLNMIKDAGFDGVGIRFLDPSYVAEATCFLRDHGMIWQAQCYPRTIDELKPVLDMVARFGADHVNLQPDIRPRRLEQCVPLLEGWRRLGREASVDVNIETHRDRMTTDLFFMLDLLDSFPDLRLTADLSHYLVGREFAWPVGEENHRLIHRILDNAWAIHGRIASREQIQIQIEFPQHRGWVDLFLAWWEHAFHSWCKRSAPDDTLTFLCELGPSPYAITGSDGRELSDRWSEACLLKDWVRSLWSRVTSEAHEQAH